MQDVIPIDEALADFLASRISVQVAACQADGASTLVRGLGARVSADRRRVTILLASAQAAPLLAAPANPPPPGPALRVRHFARNHSVFLGEDYLIKGLAGAILWVLLHDATRLGRSEFSNRALRLDPRLLLPELDDNLEARLILLQRRLADRRAPLAIEKTGRGRFRLVFERPVELVEEAGPG